MQLCTDHLRVCGYVNEYPPFANGVPDKVDWILRSVVQHDIFQIVKRKKEKKKKQTHMPKKSTEPKGLKNVFQAGVGTAETCLGFPKKAQTLMFVGVAVIGLILLVVVGTAAWGVGSGKIDVNKLADSAARGAESAAAVASKMPV